MKICKGGSKVVAETADRYILFRKAHAVKAGELALLLCDPPGYK
jgi:hypothetical protein